MSARDTYYMISDFFHGVAKLVKGMIWLVRRAFRFATGAHLDGQARTDAGWLTPGANVYTRTGRASKWAHLPRAYRAAWRWGVLVVLVLTYYGLQEVPWLVLVAYVLAAVTGAVFGILRARLKWARRRFDATTVRPLYEAIRHRLGVALYPDAEMSRLLVVPMDYETNREAKIVLALPSTFGADGKLQTELSRLVQAKLGVELDGHWSHVGQPYVEWTHKPTPPDSVRAADIRAQIDATEDDEAVIGLGSRGETISISLSVETPHIGMSIDTGGGKSSTLRGILAQFRRKGAELVICDPGGGSLPEFDGVPGVTIVTEIPDIWSIYDRVQEEMERRYAERLRNPKAKFRRLIVVGEEGNDFYLQSKAYWAGIRKKDDPQVPPIYQKKAQLMVKARKVDINIMDVFQYMEAQYTGGPTWGPLIRSQYGGKILVRWRPAVWKFLVGTNPVPRSSRHPGRGMIVVGMDARQVQLAYWTPEEAREFALGDDAPASVTSAEIVDHLRQENQRVTDVTGRPSLRVIPGGASENDADSDEETDVDPQEIDAEIDDDSADDEPETEVREGATIAAPPRRYTLAQASKDKAGIVPLSAGALRQAKHAAKTKGLYFPAGRTIDGVTKYTARELQQWYANRQQPASGE